jgi:hypothetical protein
LHQHNKQKRQAQVYKFLPFQNKKHKSYEKSTQKSAKPGHGSRAFSKKPIA